MYEEMVIQQQDNGNKIMLTQEVYEKFWRMMNLLGNSIKNINSWENPFYLLVLLDTCLDIRIPYVIEKNCNFFNQDETRTLEELHSKIKTLTSAYINNGVLCDLREVNKIINKFMTLYDTTNYFFEFRLYANKREILLVELRKCLDDAVYMKYRIKLLSAGADIKKLQEIVQECEKIILEDWRKKLTAPNKYQEGEEYAFICHAGSPKPSGLVSASLLTNKIFTTYRDSHALFILDHSSMFNTEPSDCFIDNYCPDPILAKSNHLFSILTKDTLEEETLKSQESFGKKNYNEIDLFEFKPIGILIILEDEHDIFNYRLGEKMQKKYQHLPLVYINKSIYKPKNILKELKK